MTEKELLAARQSIVQKLTQARLEKGLSQEQLAKRIGTQRSNICRIEKGTQNLSLDLMIKIAEALDKDVSVMLEERSSTMEKVYSLRLYDETLLTFTLEERGLEGLQATILHTETAKQKLFPLDLELTNEGVVKWLERRVIPKNRQFVDEILKTLGLSVNNTKGIMDVCMGLSLNDSYWVVPADFDGKYADYNLYENRFSEALSLVAYTGVGGSREAFSTSPELTTNGMLRKAWRFVEDDGIYLYKGGTEGAANTGNEPYSEYYACQIADKMGIGCVQYDLENWKGILASKCRLFTDIDTSFVPIGRILRKTTLKACLDYYKTLGDEFYEQLKDAPDFTAALHKLIRDTFSAHRRIIFNGNGYEEAWIKEAEKRGLANLHNTAEALPTYILPKNIELLTRQGVYSKEEIFSRHEVHIEKYCKVIRIEAATLVDMVQHGILNAASEYEAALCNTIAAKRAAAPELTCHVESSLANAIGSLNEQLLEETIGLKTALETVSDDAEPETLLHYYHDEVEKRTNDVRKTVDKLEVLTASKYWPYPTFCELLFSV